MLLSVLGRCGLWTNTTSLLDELERGNFISVIYFEGVTCIACSRLNVH